MLPASLMLFSKSSDTYRTIFLSFGPVLFSLGDAAITLGGQPPAYWRNDFENALESNPIGWWFLAIHPLLFVAAILAWISCFTLAIHLLKEPYDRYVSLFVAFSHAFGISTWLFPTRFGTISVVAVFVLLRIALIPAWDKQ